MRLTAAAAPTKSEAAYSSLVAAIESGRLAPGSRVTLAELASELGVSFTPVRDALVLLAEQGYIERRPNHATVIKGPLRERAAESSLLRAALEPLAARMAATLAHPESIAAIEAACDAMDAQLAESAAPPTSTANAAFHLAVGEASGSSMLAEFVSRVWKTIPVQGLTVSGRLRQAASEHRAILDAIRSGDAERAATMMADHVGHVAQATTQFLEQENAT